MLYILFPLYYTNLVKPSMFCLLILYSLWVRLRIREQDDISTVIHMKSVAAISYLMWGLLEGNLFFNVDILPFRFFFDKCIAEYLPFIILSSILLRNWSVRWSSWLNVSPLARVGIPFIMDVSVRLCTAYSLVIKVESRVRPPNSSSQDWLTQNLG